MHPQKSLKWSSWECASKLGEETCEEASDKKHGVVVGEEDDQPAGHKWERESEQEPLFPDSWETNRWKKFETIFDG